jgi:hypothetical protein
MNAEVKTNLQETLGRVYSIQQNITNEVTASRVKVNNTMYELKLQVSECSIVIILIVL